jgi:hypothetical protein
MPTPFHYIYITYKVVVYAAAERQIHGTPTLFYTTPIYALCAIIHPPLQSAETDTEAYSDTLFSLIGTMHLGV